MTPLKFVIVIIKKKGCHPDRAAIAATTLITPIVHRGGSSPNVCIGDEIHRYALNDKKEELSLALNDKKNKRIVIQNVAQRSEGSHPLTLLLGRRFIASL